MQLVSIQPNCRIAGSKPFRETGILLHLVMRKLINSASPMRRFIIHTGVCQCDIKICCTTLAK